MRTFAGKPADTGDVLIGREPTTPMAGVACSRRLVERGVRFVQLYINGQIWDNHRPGERYEGRL
jgi:hypothetical protein